ncbi:hypothetical protein E2320_000906 [Naja naja]|nr:hypothetical protein E2320_000906 [Naja naja]
MAAISKEACRDTGRVFQDLGCPPGRRSSSSTCHQTGTALGQPTGSPSPPPSPPPVQRAVSLFSLHEAMLSPEAAPAGNPGLGHLSLERQPAPHAAPVLSQQPADLSGKVSHLEAMLKQLHSDLQKEKQDKVVLQVEVATLRQSNQRLQQESQSANEQLRKFAHIFSSALDKKDL